MSAPVPTPAHPLSADALARAIHERHRAEIRGRQPPPSWEQLSDRTREQLTEGARCLQEIYAAAGDPPSRGIR